MLSTLEDDASNAAAERKLNRKGITLGMTRYGHSAARPDFSLYLRCERTTAGPSSRAVFSCHALVSTEFMRSRLELEARMLSKERQAG